MSGLAQSRAELEAVVSGSLDEATVTVYDHVPERMVIPSAVIVLGSPWIESGETFATYTVRYEVDLVPDRGSNQSQTDDVEAMVEAVLKALVQAGYTIENVAQPRMLGVNNASYLAASVTVTDAITI